MLYIFARNQIKVMMCVFLMELIRRYVTLVLSHLQCETTLFGVISLLILPFSVIVYWNIIMVFIWISLITVVEWFLCGFCTFTYFSLWSVCSYVLPIFIGISYYYWVAQVLTIVWIQIFFYINNILSATCQFIFLMTSSVGEKN